MQGPGPDSRIVYIDGAFDLFHAGHVEVITREKHQMSQHSDALSIWTCGLHFSISSVLQGSNQTN